MTAKPILVIGRNGQLARSLSAVGGTRVMCVGRPEIDLANCESISSALAAVAPRVVINAGAYTSVDKAESEIADAFAINQDGPASLAVLCQAAGIPLIHISTDCVFDGTKPEPYDPEDIAHPLSVYGRSKLAGEQAVRDVLAQHIIVRVSWVFSEFSHNFVRTMLQLAQSRTEVVVVNDQVGFPTYAPALASGLLRIADFSIEPGFTGWGTYHLAGNEAIDRAGMAREIFQESRSLGGPSAHVRAVRTAEYPTPAERPLNARLSSLKANRVFGVELPGWHAGLSKSIAMLVPELNDDGKGT
jgi:dTDP-4-dehydrorhamnose reductase